MKRRTFLASLFALPFVAKPLEALARHPIGSLFDSNKRAVDANTASVRALTEAMLNAPSGWKTSALRFDASEVRRYLTSRGKISLDPPIRNVLEVAFRLPEKE